MKSRKIILRTVCEYIAHLQSNKEDNSSPSTQPGTKVLLSSWMQARLVKAKYAKSASVSQVVVFTYSLYE